MRRSHPLFLAKQIHKSIEEADIEKLKILLAQVEPQDIDLKFEGNTALTLCVIQKRFAHAQALIQAKADLNLDMPIFHAMTYEDTKFLNLLLYAKANVNVKKRDGDTPLIKATKDENLTFVATLLEARADVNIQGERRDTALSWATYRVNTECIKILLQYKADANIPSQGGITPLMWPEENGMTTENARGRAIEDLIKYSRQYSNPLDLERKNNDGDTVLDRVLRKQCYEPKRLFTIKTLLTAKATLHDYSILFTGLKTVDARNEYLPYILKESLAQNEALSKERKSGIAAKPAFKPFTQNQIKSLTKKLNINALHYENIRLSVEITTHLPKGVCAIITDYCPPDEITLQKSKKGTYNFNLNLNKLFAAEQFLNKKLKECFTIFAHHGLTKRKVDPQPLLAPEESAVKKFKK